MFHQRILRQTQHRPWPLPIAPWRMQQSWLDLLFAHWPIPSESLQPHIPPGLTLDTFDGTAWLSIVPFRMQGVRPRGLPSVPWLSAFAELNVRTYVRRAASVLAPAAPSIPGMDEAQLPAPHDDRTRPGVLFFSLDAANPLAVEIARRFYFLPYFYASMRCRELDGAIHYHSERNDRRAEPAAFRAVYRPTGGVAPAQPNTLEHWLAERYALYTTDDAGRLFWSEIHHAPWPLQTAEVEIHANSLAESVGLTLPVQPPLLQFARRLDVLIWPLRPL